MKFPTIHILPELIVNFLFKDKKTVIHIIDTNVVRSL